MYITQVIINGTFYKSKFQLDTALSSLDMRMVGSDMETPMWFECWVSLSFFTSIISIYGEKNILNYLEACE